MIAYSGIVEQELGIAACMVWRYWKYRRVGDGQHFCDGREAEEVLSQTPHVTLDAGSVLEEIVAKSTRLII